MYISIYCKLTTTSLENKSCYCQSLQFPPRPLCPVNASLKRLISSYIRVLHYSGDVINLDLGTPIPFQLEPVYGTRPNRRRFTDGRTDVLSSSGFSRLFSFLSLRLTDTHSMADAAAETNLANLGTPYVELAATRRVGVAGGKVISPLTRPSSFFPPLYPSISVFLSSLFFLSPSSFLSS